MTNGQLLAYYCVSLYSTGAATARWLQRLFSDNGTNLAIRSAITGRRVPTIASQLQINTWPLDNGATLGKLYYRIKRAIATDRRGRTIRKATIPARRAEHRAVRR